MMPNNTHSNAPLNCRVTWQDRGERAREELNPLTHRSVSSRQPLIYKGSVFFVRWESEFTVPWRGQGVRRWITQMTYAPINIR
jgi:hypothetical protein